MLGSAIFTEQDAITLAQKIIDLERMNVRWEMTFRKGIDHETVVRLDWDEMAVERYLEMRDEF